MAETASNVTPSQPQSSSTSSQVSSTTTPATESKAPDRAEVIKNLVEQGSKKYQDKKPPTETVKSEEKKTEAKAETKANDGKGKTTDEVVSKADDKTAKPGNEKSVSETDGDPKLAARIAAIADAESKARIAKESLAKERATFETERSTHKANVAEWQKFTTTFPEDPVRALQDLGLKTEHLDALYWRLNADVLKRTKDGQPILTEADVEKRAREIAADEFRKLQEKNGQQSQEQFNAAMAEARKQYIVKVGSAFDAGKDKYPAVAALGIADGDIHSFVDEQYKAKQVIPTPDEVLAHFEAKHQARIEAAGYKKPQVEAPKAEEKKPITSSKTVTADWQAGSSPTSDNKTVSQSLKESRDEIRKKLDAGFYKRQRA